MKEKIKYAMMKLQEASDPKIVLKFKHENKSKDKSFIARMSYTNEGEPSISLISYKGYNKNYLSSQLQRSFNALRNSLALQAEPDDIILTREFINNPPGTIITLNGSTYYYSVNGGLISCNGDQLGRSFQARFIKILNAKCDADSQIMAYAQFKLL